LVLDLPYFDYFVADPLPTDDACLPVDDARLLA